METERPRLSNRGTQKPQPSVNLLAGETKGIPSVSCLLCFLLFDFRVQRTLASILLRLQS